MSGEVRLEITGSVAWLVFDHPERRNALTGPMMQQVLDILEKVDEDESIRVVVMRGAGELAFISGADISAFGSGSGVDSGPRPQDVVAALGDLGQPVIAALRGWCLGAGVLLALAADMRVAGDDVRMGIPAAKLGVAYPLQGVEQLVSLAGPAVTSEMLMTGEPFDAAGALAAGLLNRVVPADTVFSEVVRVAEILAANAPLSIQASKRAIAAIRNPSDAGMAAAAEAAVACYRSEDFAEGRRAFAEKRRPNFQGR